MMRMKVGISRKQVTDDDGSVGAICEIEVEIPGGATDAEVLRIRDHWLDLCEATVDEELGRLGGGAAGRGSSPPSGSVPGPSTRSKPTTSRPTSPDYRDSDRPRAQRDSAEDDRQHQNDAHPPTDGRQLLGWAAKQDPDAKGLVISFGKKKGFPPKIVDWDDEQVRAAYRYARGQQGRSGR